ncbi:MAG TPA: SemiSWEET transporter [Terracidiphilus sp.]|nr:SemiSWEET transporter [Terracidiphilus sp.]
MAISGMLVSHPARLFLNGATFQWIGSVAACCTTVSFLPQLVRVWQRKSAHDISLTMFLLFNFGVICWLIYGIGIGSGPVIAANASTLALSLSILILKIRYDWLSRVRTGVRPIAGD